MQVCEICGIVLFNILGVAPSHTDHNACLSFQNPGFRRQPASSLEIQGQPAGSLEIQGFGPGALGAGPLQLLPPLSQQVPNPPFVSQELASIWDQCLRERDFAIRRGPVDPQNPQPGPSWATDQHISDPRKAKINPVVASSPRLKPYPPPRPCQGDRCQGCWKPGSRCRANEDTDTEDDEDRPNWDPLSQIDADEDEPLDPGQKSLPNSLCAAIIRQCCSNCPHLDCRCGPNEECERFLRKNPHYRDYLDRFRVEARGTVADSNFRQAQAAAKAKEDRYLEKQFPAAPASVAEFQHHNILWSPHLAPYGTTTTTTTPYPNAFGLPDRSHGDDPQDPPPPGGSLGGLDIAASSVASWILGNAHWCGYGQHRVLNWKRSVAGCVPVHPQLEPLPMEGEGARVIASAALLTRCRSLELHGKTLPEYCSKISKFVPANYKVYGYLNDTIATFAAVRV